MENNYIRPDLDYIESDPQPDISKSPEMPLGLSMSLCSNNVAFDYFCSLDRTTRSRVIEYVTCAATKEEIKKNTKDAVKALSEHDLSFL